MPYEKFIQELQKIQKEMQVFERRLLSARKH